MTELFLRPDPCIIHVGETSEPAENSAKDPINPQIETMVVPSIAPPSTPLAGKALR